MAKGEATSHRKIPLPWLLGPFAVTVIAAYVGEAIGPTLITSHPLLQIFLNPKNRYLILASPQVALVPFFAVSFVRLVLTDPIAYLLGRQYGDSAMRWAEKRMGGEGEDSLVRRMEYLFGKAAPAFIVIAPSFIWCLMAGTSRMKVWVFVTCNAVGTIGRLILIRWVGDTFNTELGSLLDFIRRYQWPLLAFTITTVLVQVVRSRQRGDLETPAEMEAEITAEADPELSDQE
ncbi:MAG: VTT domain-containing protein [Acidobacteria bacterium]|nr:VTT domain-containing protein [Acidobacteriota bacterium]